MLQTPERIELEDNFDVEDDFSYFCIYDDCFIPMMRYPMGEPKECLAESCYVSREEVFG